MVRRPQQFDVIVTTNLYGAILSNVSAGITGGVGMTPGVSVGKNFALFGQVKKKKIKKKYFFLKRGVDIQEMILLVRIWRTQLH